jgi:FkbM family methyltransferase
MRLLSRFFNRILPFSIKEYLKSEIFVSKIEKNNKILRNKFYSQLISEGDIVFDVGANIGNRTQTFLTLGAKVIAIEPQNKCRTVLKLRFGKKIQIVPKGLGENDETKKFYISNTHTLSTFSNKWIEDMNKSGRFHNAHWIREKKIQMTTLKSLIKKFGVPKFVKIDVEGYEFEVLKGLHSIIDIIGFEYAIPENINGLRNCMQRLNLLNINYLYNFSVGETMEFASNKWLNFSEMTRMIDTEEFIKTGVGDIYAKNTLS